MIADSGQRKKQTPVSPVTLSTPDLACPQTGEGQGHPNYVLAELRRIGSGRSWIALLHSVISSQRGIKKHFYAFLCSRRRPSNITEKFGGGVSRLEYDVLLIIYRASTFAF
jgi:hypothetical protein